MTRRGYNLVGEKFDKLTVIRKGDTLNKKVLWECLCDCGKTSKVRTNDLTSGRIISCGCENDKRIGDLRRSHGLTNSPLYSVWHGIKQRCEYKNNNRYKYYGARGIKISQEWQDFMNFYNDMEENYQKGLSIERIDVDGHYCKENCIWADDIQQANNKRNNVIVTINGETDTLRNICRKYNVNPQMIYHQHRKGNDIEKIINELRGV